MPARIDITASGCNSPIHPMPKGPVVLAWSEPAEWRAVVRRHAREETPLLRRLLPHFGVTLLLTLAISLDWREADPGMRLPVWTLPLFATAIVVAINLLFLRLPARLFPGRTRIRGNGIETGSIVGGKSWTPAADIDGFWIETDLLDHAAFSLLCWIRTDGEEGESDVIPGALRLGELRRHLTRMGLREIAPPGHNGASPAPWALPP